MNLAEHNLSLSISEILLQSLEQPPNPFEPHALAALRLRTIDLLLRAERAETHDIGLDLPAMFKNVTASLAAERSEPPPTAPPPAPSSAPTTPPPSPPPSAHIAPGFPSSAHPMAPRASQ